MKYRTNHNGDPIVDATPEETHTLRPCVCAALRRYGCPEREIEDIAQHVEIVTWQALNDGRVHGYELTNPETALLNFMFAVARRSLLNYRHKASTRRELLVDVLPDIGASPVDRIEARDLLRRVAREPRVARFLLLPALDVGRNERRVDAKMGEGTYHVRITRMRRWLRRVARTGLWQRPPQPDPPTPSRRKKKR